jgi:selenocysteine lyase/cysteine desulfurase
VRGDLIEQMRVGSFYWMALEGAEQFHTLAMHNWELARGARRWDSPETASFFNLAAMDASLEFLLRVGVETIWGHSRRLIGEMIERLPHDRCVLASPRQADARGPYASIAARSPEKTAALYEELRAAHVFVSLRENALRIAPHLYNTERDMDRLLAVLAV